MPTSVRAFTLTLVAAGCVCVFVLATTIAEPLPPLPLDPFWLAFAGLPVVGAFILVKRPGNGVGTIVFGIGVATALSAGTNLATYAGWPRPDLLVLVNQLAFVPVFVLLPLLLLVFPDGGLPSPRWRPLVAGALSLATALTVWFALRPVAYSFDNVVFYANPWGVETLAPFDSLVLMIAQVGLTAFGVAAVIHAIRSYRHSGRLRRLQVKWVLVPAVLSPLLFAVGIMLEGVVGTEVGNLVIMPGLVGGGNGVAAGLGVAVLRHNLYEIDRIISRTLSYTLVIGLLALVVLALVAVFTRFLPSDDPLVVAVATLAVFALFNPVRHRVQRWVDRRFNRSRYDTARVIDDFTGTLQDRVDPAEVVEDWVGVVEETMQPVTVGVWVRGSAE